MATPDWLMTSEPVYQNPNVTIETQIHNKIYEPRRENQLFAYAKTKTQISFAVTAKLISAFVFATRMVQSHFYRYPKFQASSHFLWLYSPVCVGPGRKPRRPVFSERGSYFLHHLKSKSSICFQIKSSCKLTAIN